METGSQPFLPDGFPLFVLLSQGGCTILTVSAVPYSLRSTASFPHLEDAVSHGGQYLHCPPACQWVNWLKSELQRQKNPLFWTFAMRVKSLSSLNKDFNHLVLQK